MGEHAEDGRLATIRGKLPRAQANARSVAALTEHPGCARRRVIDSAGVAAYDLAERLGHQVACLMLTLRNQ